MGSQQVTGRARSEERRAEVTEAIRGWKAMEIMGGDCKRCDRGDQVGRSHER